MRSEQGAKSGRCRRLAAPRRWSGREASALAPRPDGRALAGSGQVHAGSASPRRTSSSWQMAHTDGRTLPEGLPLTREVAMKPKWRRHLAGWALLPRQPPETVRNRRLAHRPGGEARGSKLWGMAGGGLV